MPVISERGINTPAVFQEIDKIKPAYDMTYRVALFLCRLLLVVDILITTIAMAERYISFIPDPTWSEEIVLTCMSYMTMLSAALAIRRGTHIRMTAFSRCPPTRMIRSLDIIVDLTIPALTVVMITVGWKYAAGTGSRGTYVSMPKVSRFWAYLPVPLAGVAILAFEVEVLYNHVKNSFVKEGAE